MADAEVVGRLVMVSPGSLEPNPWNYNTQSEGTFAKLAASIRRHGFTRAIVVRTLEDGRMQIIDGEHGWRAAKLLGMSVVPCVDLGPVPDARAKEMTVVLNELGGTADEAALADILRGLKVDAEAMAIMPWTATELDMMTRALDFGFTRAPKGDPRPEREERGPGQREPKLRLRWDGAEAEEVARLSTAGEAEALEALRYLADLQGVVARG